jgi:hypothetical protein
MGDIPHAIAAAHPLRSATIVGTQQITDTMTIHVILFWITLALFSVVGASLSRADCSQLHALAQQHANDMARRDHLDHAGFKQHRGPAGASAENVAVGCATQACAIDTWLRSAPHRANMMLGGCRGIASAVSRSGRRYWALESGFDDSLEAR